MFHFQRSTNNWPEAVAKLPAGYMIKAIDSVQLLAEAKAHNPGIKTNLRHYWDRQVPGATDEENEPRAREFLDSFIDGTFLEGETAGLNHAAATDYIEGWNEYFGNTMPIEERRRFISWARSLARVWATEYRTRPELSHIKLILANTAIGNDLPLEVARAARDYSAVLGYHPYWPTLNNVVRPDDQVWYSGRYQQMDERFRQNGIYVEWAFTEAGAVGYHEDQYGVHLHPHDGWIKSDVHGGNIDEYLITIGLFMDHLSNWNLDHGNRAMPPVLFNSGSWPGPWESFEVNQPEMGIIAEYVQQWPVKPPIIPPDPPDPPDPPGVPYIVVANLLPQDATKNEKKRIYDEDEGEAHEHKESVVQSADDAARLVSPGRTGSKVKVWEPGRWEDDIVSWLNDRGVELVELHFFSQEGDSFELSHWPTDDRTITQAFGENPQNYDHFCDSVGLCLPGHDGIDIRAPEGTPIYAAAAGEVYRVHRLAVDGPHNYGNHIRLLHPGGYKTIYAHLSEVLTDLGLILPGGQQIGLSGNTGNSFGAHLHFGMKKAPGDPGWPWDLIDPTPFLMVL